MNRLLCVVFVACLCAGAAPAPVTLTVKGAPGFTIPKDFSGVSFETWSELPDHNKVPGHLFSADNKQLIRLFINTGIGNLRLGGGMVDTLHASHPSRADIDGVFGFAKAAHVKVIYSLQLLDGNPERDAADAEYIWTHYHALLNYFAIGNEPNEPPYVRAPVNPITNYDSYLAAWRKFAAAITKAVPEAKFVGPDSGGWAWVDRFAVDEVHSDLVKVITFHQYAGGEPTIRHGHDRVPIPPSVAINDMLSGQWVQQKYMPFDLRTLGRIQPTGLPGRMTEADDYLHGIDGASNAFASALWALDYMHWWAAQGLCGMDFHNNQWLTTDTFYIDAAGNYQVNPKAYAIRAFDIGSDGQVQPLAIANPERLNLTAYAVRSAKHLYVTIINRTYGDSARSAALTIVPGGAAPAHAAVMFLRAPNNDPGAMQRITLGGGAIANDRPWQGQWTALEPDAAGHCVVTVPATSAGVVELSWPGADEGAERQ